MTRTTVFAFVVMSVLGACMDAQGTEISTRDDNSMLRFSASNYVLTLDNLRQ